MRGEGRKRDGGRGGGKKKRRKERRGRWGGGEIRKTPLYMCTTNYLPPTLSHFTPLTMLMHKAKTLQYLVHNVPYSCLWEGLCAVLYHLVEILLHILKDKVEFVVLTDHLTEPDNVGMLQLH